MLRFHGAGSFECAVHDDFFLCRLCLHRPADADEADRERHERDIGELEPAVEAVDVVAQRKLDVAQLAPRRQHLAAEFLDGLPLSIRQDDRAAFAGGFELLQLLLDVAQLLGQRLLLLAEVALGIAPDALDERERALLDAAAPKRDELVASREVLERADDERGVVARVASPPAGPSSRASRPRTGRPACRCRRRRWR